VFIPDVAYASDVLKHECRFSGGHGGIHRGMSESGKVDFSRLASVAFR